MVKDATEAGAIGVSLGRNIFQHNNPLKIVQAIYSIIIKNFDVESALEHLKESNTQVERVQSPIITRD